jgi:hypothetical protein
MLSSELNKSRGDFERSESYIRAKQAWESTKAEYVNKDLLSFSLLLAGIFVSAGGFYLWYVKLQRFLDKKLVETVSEEHAAKRGGSA